MATKGLWWALICLLRCRYMLASSSLPYSFSLLFKTFINSITRLVCIYNTSLLYDSSARLLTLVPYGGCSYKLLKLLLCCLS